MQSKGKRGISQCMIVKNEEHNIERALSWGKGIVSEQIVVDTGSTDRTAELARKMGAEVFDFRWCDDFAAAKNYAISKAGYDWIAFLDADEYFVPEDAKRLRDFIDGHQDQYDGILTGLVSLDDEGKAISADTQFRIFRNSPNIRYQRRIHEKLVLTEGSRMQIADAVSDITIFHTGYSETARKEKLRSNRNLHLILAELKQNPEDGEMWAYLGEEYDLRKEYQQAVDALEKSVALMPEELKEYDMRSAKTFYQLLRILAFHIQAEDTSVMAVYDRAVELMPKEADYDYVVGRYYALRGNCQLAEKHLKRGLELLDKYGNSGKSAVLSGNIMGAYDLLAACCYNNGELEECVRYATMLLKENRYLMSTISVLLYAFCKDEHITVRGESGAADVAAFLGKSLYDFSLPKDRLFVLQAAARVNYKDLVVAMKRLFTVEEWLLIEPDLEKIGKQHKMRIVLNYSDVDVFNYFTDLLAEELQKKGNEIFIFDLRDSAKDSQEKENLMEFVSQGADSVICFDGIAYQEDWLLELWNRCRAVVADIFLKPPLCFHPLREKHPTNYLLFCCDRECVNHNPAFHLECLECLSEYPMIEAVFQKNYEKTDWNSIWTDCAIVLLEEINSAKRKLEDMLCL